MLPSLFFIYLSPAGSDESSLDFRKSASIDYTDLTEDGEGNIRFAHKLQKNTWKFEQRIGRPKAPVTTGLDKDVEVSRVNGTVGSSNKFYITAQFR